MKTLNLAEHLAHISFFLLILSYNFMKFDLLGQIGMILFCSSIAILCIAKRKLKFSYYFVFMLSFILFNYFNTIQGNAISSGTALDMITSLSFSLIMLFFAYNYFVICENKRKPLDTYVNSIMVTSIIVVFLNINTLFIKRLSVSELFNANHISFVVMIAMYITLYDYIVYKRKNSILKTLWFLFIGLLTGSRKGIFMIFFGIVFLIYTLQPKKIIRNILIGSIFVIVLYFLIFNVPILYNLVGSRVEVIFQYLNSGETTEYSLTDRLNYINIGWNYFLQKPWTGYGLNCFKLLPDMKQEVYSHNNFVELLFSGGIIAFTIYYLNYLIAIIRNFLSIKSGVPQTKLMLTIILSMLVIDYGYVGYYDRIRLLVWIMVVAYTKIAVQDSKALNFHYSNVRRKIYGANKRIDERI